MRSIKNKHCQSVTFVSALSSWTQWLDNIININAFTHSPSILPT